MNKNINSNTTKKIYSKKHSKRNYKIKSDTNTTKKSNKHKKSRQISNVILCLKKKKKIESKKD